MNMRRALPLRSFAVFNSNSLTSSVSSMLVPPQALFFAQYTIVGRFSLRESLRRVHFTQMKMLLSEGKTMPTEDEMTLDERRKYLKRMKLRYIKAKREERSVLLSEMEQVTGMHRKSLTRLLHAQSLERKKRQSPRRRSYGKAVEEVIVSIWESLDYICAERLTPILLTMAQHLARFGAVKLTSEVEEQLQTISRATVSRVLRAYRSRRRRLPQKGAERANQVTKGVPMGRLAWDLKEPGHFEVDLVYHSGESTTGEHGHTIQMVDVATGWSERVAVMGRGQRAMEAGFEHLLSRLPFAIVELHPDN